MAIPSLTLRQVKGSALSFAEADQNFQNLANAVVQVSAGGTTSNIALNGLLTIANSETVQATMSSGTLTFVSNITGGGGSALGWTLDLNTAANEIAVGDGGTLYILDSSTINWIWDSENSQLSIATAFDASSWGSDVAANDNGISSLRLDSYRESVGDLGSSLSGTQTINASSGPVQAMSISGSITINAQDVTLGQGQSVTLLITHADNNLTLTSDMLFAEGAKTLSTTSGSVDALTIFYDGTNYLCSLVRYS